MVGAEGNRLETGKGEDSPKVSRMFYITVTQQALLLGAESWDLTGKMEAELDAFQGRVARRLTGRTPCRGRDREWFCLYTTLFRSRDALSRVLHP